MNSLLKHLPLTIGLCLFTGIQTDAQSVSDIAIEKNGQSCHQSIAVKTDNENSITHINKIGAFNGEILLNGKTRVISDENADSKAYNESDEAWNFSYNLEKGLKLEVISAYKRTDNGKIAWDLSVRNPTSDTLVIKSWCVPFEFNNNYVLHQVRKLFETQVIYQNWINGHSSYIMSMLPTGMGKYLLITPSGDTSIDYYEQDAKYYLAYENSKIDKVWNRKVSTIFISPMETHTFSLLLETVGSYEEAQKAFVENGDVAIEVASSMTVQKDKAVKVAIQTSKDYEIQKKKHCRYKYIGRTDGWDIYEFRFKELGESQVVVEYDGGKQCYMDFFVTEPLKALIEKRVRHIVDYQQVNDSSVWYDAMYGQWEMHKSRMLTPKNNEEYYSYIACGTDDPSLSKSTLIAAKNLVYPDEHEIRSLERYIGKFLWGGLQRTDSEEPFPFGIYGADGWHFARNSKLGYNVGGIESERMWRSFDYSHIFKLYYYMYHIAKLYPDLMEYADYKEYLRRAYKTAMAFYIVPYSINMSSDYWSFSGWCDWSYKLGVFHERALIDIIHSLEQENMMAEAATLRNEWEKKVKYFVYDTPYPYGSEMSIDATAFESTYAVAKYGLTHEVKPDSALWTDKKTGQVYSHPSVTKQDFADFMERQLYANLASRGVLQKSFYNYGSDMRGSGSMHYQLSYMAQLGGAPILDYGLYFAKSPDRYLRWGYGSVMSAWSLVNTGYWYPGEENIGGAGWAFEPCIDASMWCTTKTKVSHSVWPLDGEIDCGFIGAIDAAATIVYDSPIFGRVALGGTFKKKGKGYELTPEDGIAQRLRCRDNDAKVDIDISRDCLLKSYVSEDKTRFELTIDNITNDAHTVDISAKGLPNGRWTLKSKDVKKTIEVTDGSLTYPVAISGDRLKVSIELND